MHAFLFVNPDDEIIKQKQKEIGAKVLEFPLQKIDDVREINSFTKLKLIEKTVIYIRDFDKATNEAQNAFLKSLEEPQDNLFFILTATNLDKILDTIISRCEVVEIQSDKLKVNSETQQEIEKFIKAEVGEKLKIINKINKKEEAIEFANNLIVLAHKIIHDEPDKYKFADEAIKLKRNLEVNGNIQLQLTNFVVDSRT